jgi:hypothetical protein
MQPARNSVKLQSRSRHCSARTAKQDACSHLSPALPQQRTLQAGVTHQCLNCAGDFRRVHMHTSYGLGVCASAGSVYILHATTSTAAKPVAAVARPATDVLSTGLPSRPARPLLPVAPFSSWTAMAVLSPPQNWSAECSAWLAAGSGLACLCGHEYCTASCLWNTPAAALTPGS